MVEKHLSPPKRRPNERDPEKTRAGPIDKDPRSHIQLKGVLINGNVRKAVLRVDASLLKERGGKSCFVTVKEGEMIGDTGDYRLVEITGTRENCSPVGRSCVPYIYVNYNGVDYEIALSTQD
jgi:hypothetical protein